MKRSILNVLIIGLLFIFICGCVPEPINIDVKPAETKLVVTSQVVSSEFFTPIFSPQQFLTVAITKTFSPLSPISTNDAIGQNELNEILVPNAIVTLSYLNTIDTLQMVSSGIYTSKNIMLDNYGTYSIFIKDPATGLQVMAVSELLPRIKFDTVYPIITRNVTDTSVFIDYELTDNTSEENYYEVNYIHKQSTSGLHPYIKPYIKPGSSVGVKQNIGSFLNISTDFDLLTDASFTNGKFTNKRKLSNIGASDSMAVEVSNITKGYYDFLVAYKRSGKLINQLTGEPITFPSNVQNGYGYFNVVFPDVKFFDLKNY